MSEPGDDNPLAGLFGLIGAFVGFGYGAQISGEEPVVAIIGLFAGIFLGYVVAEIAVRLILIALLIIMILARQAFFEAIADTFSYTPAIEGHEAIVLVVPDPRPRTPTMLPFIDRALS